ncbi:imidazole glycerol phosphate synthase cyclase subunit [Anaerosporomusa subterranea]|uniref:Imidazole glycerol phosphate synthase subunit HisF n=1 Tax=Anaerosporomusa subterranea TaxID=1794912 RepID=A0A154BR69_ANASB|nr:AglZ/HisF2 family acetamidino modification protein [Anaerosporomusa subterranea]KYZ76421.1 imidazole glycerol phosphate synthase cyclase subunit [Anaerosporomusa subterranea]
MYLRPRVIPCLLLKNNGLVKTVKFKDPRYLGDPINAVRIFNEKYVDELAILDIVATKEKRSPNLELLSRIAAEAFMPMCYGGGISTLDEVKIILGMGFEKVVINTSAVKNPMLIQEASGHFGSQSIVVSIDVKKNFFGKYRAYINCGEVATDYDPAELARKVEQLGAGEIFLNSIDKDGTMSGYDLGLIKKVSESVGIPVIACGGARNVDDLSMALHNGKADAMAAGSMFVYYGKHKAVLITFPNEEELIKAGVFT